MQVPEFLQQCWRLIRDVKSSEGKRALRGIAYIIAATKLYSGPNNLSSNPMRGGLSTVADKLGMHVRCSCLSLFTFGFSTVNGACG